MTNKKGYIWVEWDCLLWQDHWNFTLHLHELKLNAFLDILNGVTCGKMPESHHEHVAWRCYYVKWVVIQQQMSVYISSNARMEPVNVGKLTMTQWGALTWFVREWRNLVTRCKLTTMSKRNMISQNPTLFSWLEVLDPQSWIEPTVHDLTWSHSDSHQFDLRLTSVIWGIACIAWLHSAHIWQKQKL